MVELDHAAAGRYLLPRDSLRVSGPDRKTWLDGLLTCGVAGVVPGVAAYGLLLTKQGKIVSDAFLTDSGSELFIGVAPGRGAAVRELLERYLVMEDAELFAADGVSWSFVPGQALPAALSALAFGQLLLGGLQGQLELSAAAPAGALPELAELLAEYGLGSFGVDFGERDNPHEASLDRIAVSWTKGCYLGQEVVCMQDMRGKVKRRLVALDGEPELLQAIRSAPAEAAVLGPDGASFGQVSSAHVAASGATRLLASLSSSALESQTPLHVLGRPVRVVEAAGPLLS